MWKLIVDDATEIKNIDAMESLSIVDIKTKHYLMTNSDSKTLILTGNDGANLSQLKIFLKDTQHK